MNVLVHATAPVLLAAVAASPLARPPAPLNPLQFFVGVTETVGTTKVVMHKPVKTHSLGRGQISPDGSLVLVQKVEDEGRAPYLRRWQIRQTGAGRFEGTMSEAVGPVAIAQVGNRYRFTFKMKGNLSVEQWLTPVAGGVSASSDMIVRKFGFAVARSTALVRKVL